MSRCKFHPGDTVYVVERDEYGFAADVGGYVFLAQVCDAAIVTICDFRQKVTVDEIMEELIENTIMEGDTNVNVYPIGDCFYKKDDADAVFEAEKDDFDDE